MKREEELIWGRNIDVTKLTYNEMMFYVTRNIPLKIESLVIMRFNPNT